MSTAPKPTSVHKALSTSVEKVFSPPQGDCYKTAVMAMYFIERTDLLYIEGLVISNGIPIEHGWLQIDSTVIDPYALRFDYEAADYFPIFTFTKAEIVERVHKAFAKNRDLLLPLMTFREPEYYEAMRAALDALGMRGE